MKCQEVRHTLSLDDPGQRPELPRLREHLEGCPGCQREFPEVRWLLAQSASSPERLASAFDAVPSQHRPPRRRQLVVLAAAAAAALLISVVGVFLTNGDRTDVSAPSTANATEPDPPPSTAPLRSLEELIAGARRLSVSSKWTHTSERRTRGGVPRSTVTVHEVRRFTSPSQGPRR